MYDVLLILTLFTLSNTLWFFLGRSSHSLKLKLPHKSKVDDSFDAIVERAKSAAPKRNRVLPGILPFKTQEQRDDEASGEAALDQHWRESGIAEKVMQ